jgi:DNA-binding winged helix-turn-helix (wHTH) protein/tetratricopeptide (TPR) repeat protein
MAVKGVITFEQFELDLERRELRRNGILIAIQKKPLGVLIELVRRKDRLVTKSELLEAVWSGVTVSEHALTSAVRDLRQALGDLEHPHRLIATVRGQGFRLAVEVNHLQPPPASGHPGPDGPFVDREDVMSQLRAALGRAIAGTARVTFIAGPPGIGKTRTASQLVHDARGLGVEAHLARCYGGDGATPFWPWLQLVRGCLGGVNATDLEEPLKGIVHHLAWIAPDLADPRTVEARDDLDRVEARFRLFDAVGMLFRELARRRPLLLFIDDLHWADEASLLLLEFLAQNLPDSRIHLIGAFRDGEVGPDHALTRVLGALAREFGAERIELEGLRSESVAGILRDAAGREPTPMLAKKVFGATGGNPFFVTELANLIASGQLDVTTSPNEIPLSNRVRDAVRLHLRSRTFDCRRLLALASVVGQEIDLSSLSRAFGESSSRTLVLLDEAEAAGLVKAIPDKPRSYSFVHDLVRETLYRDTSRGERSRLHGQMARALESLGATPERLDGIAYHYGEAAALGDAEKAVEYAQRAGEHANALMAFEDAVVHYDRALGALDLVAAKSPELECRIRLAQAEAAWGTLEPAVQVQDRFVRAARSARSIGNADLLARAALGRTGHGSGPGDYRDIGTVDLADVELLSEANDALGGRPSALKALVLSRLALAVRYSESPALAESMTNEATAIARELDDPETLASVLRYRHEVISGPSYARERVELAHQIESLARAVKSRPLQLDALFFLARDQFELANLQAASEAGRAADALAATMRHPGAAFRSGIRRVLRSTLAGAFDEAATYALRFFERDRARNLSAHGTFSAQSIMIYISRGDHEAAIREILSGATVQSAFRWGWYALAREYTAVGRTEEARVEFERAATDSFRRVPQEHTFLGSVMILADLCYEFQDSRRAEHLYGLALPFESMIAAPYIATLCLGSVARALGTLAHLLGQYDRAEAHFRRALGVEQAMRAAPLCAETQERYAKMLLARARPGDTDRALRLLGEAGEIAAKLGMKRLHRQTALDRRGAELQLH